LNFFLAADLRINYSIASSEKLSISNLYSTRHSTQRGEAATKMTQSQSLV
jgi:hypothetical protein